MRVGRLVCWWGQGQGMPCQPKAAKISTLNSAIPFADPSLLCCMGLRAGPGVIGTGRDRYHASQCGVWWLPHEVSSEAQLVGWDKGSTGH